MFHVKHLIVLFHVKQSLTIFLILLKLLNTFQNSLSWYNEKNFCARSSTDRVRGFGPWDAGSNPAGRIKFKNMKKNYKLFLLIFIFIISPFIIQAAGLVPCGGDGEPSCGLCHLFVMIRSVIVFLTGIAAVVLAIMLIVGGIMFVTAHGNPEWVTKARKTITGAIIGFLIVIMSWIIVNSVITFATGSENIFQNMGPWHKIQCNP